MRTKLLSGNNRLRLCPDTLHAIPQAWLDEEVASPVEVLGISYRIDDNTIEVRFTRAEETQNGA